MLTAAQIIKKFPAFMEPKGSEQRATSPCQSTVIHLLKRFYDFAEQKTWDYPESDHILRAHCLI
jgi:hypothetical protein